MTRVVLVVVVLLFSPSFLSAQAVTDPSGHWEGAIQTPEASLNIEVDLARDGQALAGTISVPSQNLRSLPLVIEPIEVPSVSFRFKGAPGRRHFLGTLSDDGSTIAGEFIQAGYAMPFSLKRRGDARIEAPVKSPPIGKELEGPWSAVLEGTYPNGLQRRLILTLSNQPDGTSTGTIVNPGDGLEIPITSIRQMASSVTLDLKAVSGSYSGKVNADGTEIVGTLIQGTAVLPLTFRRAPADAEKPQ
jgi:uncharacterized protein